MNNKTLKIIEVASNIVMFLFLIVSIILIFIDVSNGKKLVANGFESLKFFTVESNIFMGVMAGVSLFYIKKEMPLVLKVIKYVACCTVTLTFLTVMLYLGPIYGHLRLLENSNLFMHLLLPVVAIIHMFFFEPKIEKPKFIYTLYSIIPMFIYGVCYLINVAANNGYGNIDYDWYFFGQWGIGLGIVAFLLMIVFAYAIGVGIYFGYTKINIQKKSASE